MERKSLRLSPRWVTSHEHTRVNFRERRRFKEAGGAAAAQDRPDEGRAFYLKGLNLLLGILGEHETSEHPDYVPPVEIFTVALSDAHLPAPTQAMLMRHEEHKGEFGKAEDALFALLDAAPGSREVLDFGISFYERLRGQSDGALDAGNLPRHRTGIGSVRTSTPEGGGIELM